MANPKRRTSKSRRDHRRAHWKTAAANVVTCPQCSEAKLPHHVCKKCGTYNNQTVLEIK